jgi:hypothetical protein
VVLITANPACVKCQRTGERFEDAKRGQKVGAGPVVALIDPNA